MTAVVAAAAVSLHARAAGWSQSRNKTRVPTSVGRDGPDARFDVQWAIGSGSWVGTKQHHSEWARTERESLKIENAVHKERSIIEASTILDHNTEIVTTPLIML